MSESEVQPTAKDSKIIKAINKDTVHKICSGQVILTLAIAVKELLENSIDANATTVEVKLKNFGETIEVSDNGRGVAEGNFEGLTAKYCTSKLRDFTDLSDISTYGFRGEALSSLCALSKLEIVTRHETAEHGTKLEMDTRGVIVKRSICPRPVGTTVIVSKLFSTLPVRHTEFLKHLKREYGKMLQVVQAYCLICKGVRIIVSNQNKTVMATTGTDSIKDNIISVFGKKQMDELIEIKPPLSEGTSFSEQTLLDEEDPNSSLDVSVADIERMNSVNFGIEGYISSCRPGCGRSSKDRQFFYINDRPCDFGHISKLVNEVYHKYNASQMPFVLLNLKIQRSEVDVNITPDKRQLMINNEKILLLALKKSLVHTIGPLASTYRMQNVSVASFCLPKPAIKDEDDEADDDGAGPNILKLKPSGSKFSEKLLQWQHSGLVNQKTKNSSPVKRKLVDPITRDNTKLQKIQQFLSQEPPKLKNEPVEGVPTSSVAEYDTISTQNMSSQEKFDYSEIRKTISDLYLLTPPESDGANDDSSHQITCTKASKSPSECKLIVEPNECVETIDVDNEPAATAVTVSTTIDGIRQLMQSELELKTTAGERRTNLSRLKFKAGINPSKNSAAQNELDAEITKESFSQMDIVGQFNLGFIVARLDQDLFIIDQHASDEKYNFETLQKSTVLVSQTCVHPQPLQLSAVNEQILIDNLRIFEQNGFKFQIDEEAEPNKRVKLTAKPMSGHYCFGKEDIDELIFMLQDAPPSTSDTRYRPSKVRDLLASRACRKSVMFGDALTRPQMKALVGRMGTIDHPWNCPHGRPTMRHLINLSMLEETGDVCDS